MKKYTPTEWSKISKQVHSMSDVITAAHINSIRQEDPNDDFGTADLSDDGKDHYLDAVRYSLSNAVDNYIKNPIKSPAFVGDFELSPDFKMSGPEMRRFEFEVTFDLLKNVTLPQTKSCTCGASKTYGPSCSKSFHSSWCDLK